MKLTTAQSAHLDRILSIQSGEFSEADIRPEWTAFLRSELDAGRLGDPVEELSVQSLKRAIKGRGWKVDDAQPRLFEADALLAIGDGVHVRMEDANARHVGQHLDILRVNFERQSATYELKAAYLAEMLPVLFASKCTLGDLESGTPEAEAA